jgi:hypothetical protein
MGMHKGLGQLLTALGIAVLLILGLWAIHAATSARVRDQDKYQIALADIDCPSPPGQSRDDFLSEIQYLADLPPRLSVLDSGLAGKLAEAFAAHPWVEKVNRVEIVPKGQVNVSLVFRTPVLAVGPPRTKQTEGGPLGLRAEAPPSWLRAVDGRGFILPARAPVEGLPIMHGSERDVPAPAGRRWINGDVQAAARTAAFLHEHQQALHLIEVTATDQGLVWLTPGKARILWGRPPGAEVAGEPPAKAKLDKLLLYCKQQGDRDHIAGSREIDLRR